MGKSIHLLPTPTHTIHVHTSNHPGQKGALPTTTGQAHNHITGVTHIRVQST